MASEISAMIAEEAFDALKAPIRRVASADVPIPFSPALESAVLPTEGRLIDAIRSTL
jgi:pyruvate dehydrogenase E1 component beta subunit